MEIPMPATERISHASCDPRSGDRWSARCMSAINKPSSCLPKSRKLYPHYNMREKICFVLIKNGVVSERKLSVFRSLTTPFFIRFLLGEHRLYLLREVAGGIVFAPFLGLEGWLYFATDTLRHGATRMETASSRNIDWTW